MKLRIKGNSLRFRLTRSEVEKLHRTNSIEERVTFGPRDYLYYRIEGSDGDDVTAALLGSTITISVPSGVIDKWAGGDEVGIEARQPIDDSEPLDIMIEKDFVCLTPREGEDSADHYPHPGSGETC